MNVEDIPPGRTAPEHSDRIVIFALPDGTFRFEAIGARNKDVSVHFVDTDTFATVEDARAAGIAWGMERRISDISVELRPAE